MLEPQHRAAPTFDVPMILFNDVVEILALADLDTLVVVNIVVSDRRCVRAAFIDIDQTGFSIPFDHFG